MTESPDRRTIYVSIGNSDDKLSQYRWSGFYRDVNMLLRREASGVHGQWVSEPASAWQNACWCVEVDDFRVAMLRNRLGAIAAEYDQDCIAWAEAPKTEFIGALELA